MIVSQTAQHTAPAVGTRPDSREWRYGTVIWFDAQKGFGYLAPEDDIAPVYVEYRSIDSTGYRTLFQGERVEFTSAQRAGGAEAVTVRRCDRADAALPAAGAHGVG